MRTRSYSELAQLATFSERFKYLALRGQVGAPTFGSDRWINQRFYMSTEWRNLRHQVIARDNGCDLAMDGYEIAKGLYIHHMNPVTLASITEGDEDILDPEYLITVTHITHNAIHYGDARQVPRQLAQRTSGDTKLW